MNDVDNVYNTTNNFIVDNLAYSEDEEEIANMLDKLYEKKQMLLEEKNIIIETIKDIVVKSKYNKYCNKFTTGRIEVLVTMNELDEVDRDIKTCKVALKKKLMLKIKEIANVKNVSIDRKFINVEYDRKSTRNKN